jgi:2-haloacid dehalogenase
VVKKLFLGRALAARVEEHELAWRFGQAAGLLGHQAAGDCHAGGGWGMLGAHRPALAGSSGERLMAGNEHIKACVFDAYGTLFDVHSSVGRHHERLGHKAGALSALWRQKQLEYTWLRSLMGRHADFWQVTGEALDYAFEHFDVVDQALRSDLLAAYRELDCYPEVRETLRTLRDRGLATAILSNGSPEMLASAVGAAGIRELLDEVLSVEEVGIYKPAPAVYQLAVDGLRVDSGRILFMSSNGWDIAGAAAFGFHAVWVNRSRQTEERLPARPERVIASLDELPASVPSV